MYIQSQQFKVLMEAIQEWYKVHTWWVSNLTMARAHNGPLIVVTVNILSLYNCVNFQCQIHKFISNSTSLAQMLLSYMCSYRYRVGLEKLLPGFFCTMGEPFQQKSDLLQQNCELFK